MASIRFWTQPPLVIRLGIYIHIVVIWINVSWRSNQLKVLHVKKNLEVDHIIRRKPASKRAWWVHVCVPHCSFLVLTMVLFLFGDRVIKVERGSMLFWYKRHSSKQQVITTVQAHLEWTSLTSTMASSTFQCQIVTYFVFNVGSSWNWSGMPTTCTVVKVAWLQKTL